jgi:tricorn protease
MTFSSYFRFPHLHGDLVTFVAEDDVWIAPLGGGRAWRVSALQLPARNPRFTPDGKRLVWSVVQGTAPEVVSAEVDGGGYRQLTFFGHSTTRVKGFTAGGSVVVTSAFRQAESRHTHAYSVPLEGGWAEELPFGPVESVAFGPEVGDERPVVVGSVLSREPAWWKRYRGGTAGKLWIDADGNGEFERLVPELDGNLADPMWVDGRIAFLSDHEGYGNLYSVLPSGKDLRRHTDHEDFYVRHAATDGKRVIFESAGELWVLHDLGSDAVRLDITLGSASQSRRPALLKTAKHLGAAVPDTTGSASAIESHGTIHWLRHKDGPSRIIEATPGVRARLPRPLGDGRIAYLADHGNVEALYIKDIAAPVPHAGIGGADAGPDAVAARSAADVPAPVAAGREEVVILPQPVPAAGAAALAGNNPRAGLNTQPGNTAQAGNTGQAGNAVPAHASDEQADVAPGAGTSPVEAQALPVETRIGFPRPSRASALEASPDGNRLALGTSFGEVYVADTRTGELTLVSSIGEGMVGELSW